ncbi:MAG: efflux RND transporter permease subunit [Acidobacteria bacterium]|nr:efflux RND transporter permease subunit [Acidobacteriota bacterium]
MHALAELCVRRPVFATMLVVSLTVVGLYSFFGLGVDLLPNIDVPTVSITVQNPGASPEQIETEITKPIEAAVNTISGIDELRSTSVEGSSQVTVAFLLDKDSDVAAQEVRDKVNLVIRDLPDTALQPVVQKFDPGAQPILQIVVASRRPLRDLTRLADERIKQALESVSGVGEVRIVGGADREIQIRVDPDSLRAHNLTVSDIATALRQQNIELPGGRVQQGSEELTVRTLGRITNPKDFEGVAVATRGQYVERIADVATVVDGQEELRSASFLNGEAAVTLVVSKQSGQNTVAIAGDVKTRLAELSATLPSDIRTYVLSDQSIFIEAAVRSLEEHLLLGGLLAAGVIFLFLANTRTTVIAALAIPISIVSTFALMRALGYTLNQLTMLALTLMVGVVIDDAIIVLENIFRHIEEKGMRPFEAAIEGTREIGLAVMATTLSLMAVFVPVGFMGGIVGRFMSSFGLTAAFAIGVSLFVSFTLTPMLASRFIKTRERASHASSKETVFFRPIDRTYMVLLRWSMAHRWSVVTICVLVIVSTVPIARVMGANFTPTDDRSEFQVNVRTPEGTGLAATLTVVQRIANDLRAQPEITDTLVTGGASGGGGGLGGGGGVGGVNAGSINVRLVPLDARDVSQEDVMVRVRELLRRYPSDLYTSVGGTGGPGGGGGIQYAIRGPDLKRLTAYAATLMEKIKTIPGLVEPDSSLRAGRPELRVEIDRQRASDLGIRVQDIAQTVNTLVGGQRVSTFDDQSYQFKVTLRAEERFRTGPEGLQRLSVSAAGRTPVALGDVVRIRPSDAPSSIQRINRERQVTLSANLAPGGSQSVATAALDRAAADLQMPAGYVAGAAGGSRELARTAGYFLIAISLSFIFMYIVLAAQFESFLHPITILLTLPLAVPFGLLSLLIGGQSITIYSGLGLLLLFGIVKKNAILQIDHMNNLRNGGMARHEAILQANRDRLRPILMTTVALVAGMLPLVLSSGPGSGTNRSIGVLVVGGQSLCLVLTLLAVPVFYSLFDDVQTSTVWARMGQFANVGRLVSFAKLRSPS